MLKYVSKFALDILPSVVATIIGAYIVNHYIVAKPADAPVAAAVSTSDPAKADPKPSESVAALPEAGVKAKGISERAVLEKTATEKPAVVDKPADTAGGPAEPRRHQPVLREKAVAKAVQTPMRLPPPAGRSRCCSGREARRQRSRARGDRAFARHQRSLAACAGSRAYPGCSPGPRGAACGLSAGRAAVAAADHGFRAQHGSVQSRNGLCTDQAALCDRPDRRSATADAACRYPVVLAASRPSRRGDAASAA